MAVLADAVNPRDVLVVELGRRPALLVESQDDLGVARLVQRQKLESHIAIELSVVGAEDGSHAPHTNGFLEQKRPDHLARTRHRSRQGGRGQRRSFAAPGCSECESPSETRGMVRTSSLTRRGVPGA